MFIDIIYKECTKTIIWNQWNIVYLCVGHITAKQTGKNKVWVQFLRFYVGGNYMLGYKPVDIVGMGCEWFVQTNICFHINWAPSIPLPTPQKKQ